MTTARNTGLQR